MAGCRTASCSRFPKPHRSVEERTHDIVKILSAGVGLISLFTSPVVGTFMNRTPMPVCGTARHGERSETCTFLSGRAAAHGSARRSSCQLAGVRARVSQGCALGRCAYRFPALQLEQLKLLLQSLLRHL